jgi:polysaccharide export outer membrane protein
MTSPSKGCGVLLLFATLALCENAMFAQESSDISATSSTVPGMERTTNFKNLKTGAEGAASAITPAATGRMYPASGELLIGVGDRLHIAVFETPEFDQDARVDPSGTIDVAGVGSVPATNRRPKDVAADIQRGLKDGGIMLNPAVTVEITDYISHGVSIEGEVRTPGIYPIMGQRRLSDLLTASGGPTELSDGTAEVRHGAGGETAHILLKKDAENTTVVPGDTITLDRAPLVYILGNVRRSGGFPLARRTTLAQGLALAQGFSASARDRKAYLFRDQGDGQRMVVEVNLHDIMRGKRPDMDMKPNDVLFVPNSALADVAKAAAAILPTLAVAEVYTHP